VVSRTSAEKSLLFSLPLNILVRQLKIRQMAGFLQSPASAPGAGKPDADGGLARRRWRRARRRGCGYDAALGQPWRIAHIPTAAATASTCRLRISGGRSGGASN
jgi:hypothetical protein